MYGYLGKLLYRFWLIVWCRRFLCTFIAGAACVPLLTACSIDEDTRIARQAVASFHQRLNQGDYREIYGNAAREFVESDTEENLVAFLQAVHAKLGDHIKAVQTNWHVNYGSQGRIVTLVYDSEYQQGRATETFVFRISDGQARLIRYDVNSRALLLDPGPRGQIT